MVFVVANQLPEYIWEARKEQMYSLINEGYTLKDITGKLELAPSQVMDHFNLKFEDAKKEAKWYKERIKFGMVGNSNKFKKLTSDIEKVLYTDSTVLITGETGTGKNMVARAIHAFGSKKDGPLITVSIPSYKKNIEVIHTDLFGYKKGAFTGAYCDKEGKFVAADGGIIFLNQINSLECEAQGTFLEYFDYDGFTTFGSELPSNADVRVLVSANEDLIELVREKKFKEDLYYRLNEIEINVPPLRKRKEDIPLLVQYFLKKYNGKEGKKIEIGDEQVTGLLEYDWPGNIRELEKLIKRSVVLEEFKSPKYNGEVTREKDSISLDEFIKEGKTLDEFMGGKEKSLIKETLEKTGGNVKKASELLRTEYRSLRYRIKKYGRDIMDFKS